MLPSFSDFVNASNALRTTAEPISSCGGVYPPLSQPGLFGPHGRPICIPSLSCRKKEARVYLPITASPPLSLVLVTKHIAAPSIHEQLSSVYSRMPTPRTSPAHKSYLSFKLLWRTPSATEVSKSSELKKLNMLLVGCWFRRKGGRRFPRISITRVESLE